MPEDLKLFDQGKVLSTEEFLKIAIKYNKIGKDGSINRLGFHPLFAEGNYLLWARLFESNKAKPMQNGIIQSDEIIDSFEYLRKWRGNLSKDRLDKFIDKIYPEYAPSNKFPFTTGNMVFVINGSWLVESLRKYLKDEQWGVAPLPSDSGKNWSFIGNRAFVIPKGSRKLKEALSFIKFATGEEGQKIASRNMMQLPSLKLLANNSAWGK